MKQAHAAGVSHFSALTGGEGCSDDQQGATGIGGAAHGLEGEVSMAGRLMRAGAKGIPATMPRMIRVFQHVQTGFFSPSPAPRRRVG